MPFAGRPMATFFYPSSQVPPGGSTVYMRASSGRGAREQHDLLEVCVMTLQIGSTAPDFEADTTEGHIKFHEWLAGSWGVLFSHPKDFTPVCATELGTVARIKPEFDKRGVKVIALSVDPVDSHKRWIGDIEDTQKITMNFPIIGDTDSKVSNLYG